MPRRKTYKILAKETDFYALLVSELQLMKGTVEKQVKRYEQ